MSNRENNGHILIKLPTGKSMATKSSDQNQNNPLATAFIVFND